MAHHPKQPTILMVKEQPGPTRSVRQEYQDDKRSVLLHESPVQIAAKQTDNMFTGTSADQQRKDASATRDPPRPNIHAITESSPHHESSFHVILPEQIDPLSTG